MALVRRSRTGRRLRRADCRLLTAERRLLRGVGGQRTPTATARRAPRGFARPSRGSVGDVGVTATVIVEWDVPVTMPDGAVLRADVFRPESDDPVPVVMTAGPYAKGLAFQEGFAGMWANLVAKHPEVELDSTGRYQNWEAVDPEKWVPDGYACLRLDSRGAGRSPGYLDIFSRQEIDDYVEAIEWAASQPWSNGKVGLLGISYYAMNQWLVAARRPPHLAAIIPWEGASDFYREFTRHGGILNDFTAAWFPNQITTVQYGVGERGRRHQVTGVPVGGDETLTEDQLAANRADAVAELRARPLLDEWYTERTPVLEDIEVPVLSAANWAHWLHTRGNFEAYARVSSPQRWLEVHGLEHYAEFYTDYGLALQKRFFGHFLKGEDTWSDQPPVRLQIRNTDGTFTQRDEREWPLARTRWTHWYLDPGARSLRRDVPGVASTVEIDIAGRGETFWSAPFDVETEVTGPAVAPLTISCRHHDVDVFVVLRVQDPEGQDVTFVSGIDPHGVVAAGWLRASHRAVDPERSLPYRPWHPHDRAVPLTPDEPTELLIEIWPTSVVIPAGYRIGLTVGGSDFEFPGDGPWPSLYGVEFRGHGMFVHTDPVDRPERRCAGTLTVHGGDGTASRIVLPEIPPPS